MISVFFICCCHFLIFFDHPGQPAFSTTRTTVQSTFRGFAQPFLHERNTQSRETTCASAHPQAGVTDVFGGKCQNRSGACPTTLMSLCLIMFFFSVAVYHPRGIISWEDNPGELEVFHMFFRQTFCFGAESHPTCCFVLCRSIPKAEPLHRPAFHAPLDQHKYGNPCMFLRNDLNWLVVWNMNFIVPYIGNNHPN